MKIFTYTEARQQLAGLLDRASRDGRVRIRRRDGQVFDVTPGRPARSPLDVVGVSIGARAGETLEWIDESRRSTEHVLDVLDSSRAAAKSTPARASAKRSPRSRKR